MAWMITLRGEGSMRNLKPFPTCGKAEIFQQNRKRHCTKWVRAVINPHLWTEERIRKACRGCEFNMCT